MPKTRLSLYYLATYLWVGGVGLLFMPRLSANLLLSNTEYSAVMLQSLGMFMVGVGIIVVQIIRLRISVLYPTTIFVRLFFCVCLLFFYFTTQNPFFIVLLCIVVLGLLLTGTSYLSERNERASGGGHR
jgi:uncharacterized protein YjeT (DUF2065 family)